MFYVGGGGGGGGGVLYDWRNRVMSMLGTTNHSLSNYIDTDLARKFYCIIKNPTSLSTS